MAYTSPGYEDEFLSKRAWFFGLLAVTYLLDVIDSLLKGEQHFALFVILRLIAIATDNRIFQRVSPPARWPIGHSGYGGFSIRSPGPSLRTNETEEFF